MFNRQLWMKTKMSDSQCWIEATREPDGPGLCYGPLNLKKVLAVSIKGQCLSLILSAYLQQVVRVSIKQFVWQYDNGRQCNKGQVYVPTCLDSLLYESPLKNMNLQSSAKMMQKSSMCHSTVITTASTNLMPFHCYLQPECGIDRPLGVEQ